ncbi:MAG: FHA domain-containing protein [Lachnospiraceae bacterium]|nr:FHA domain-containing protein [Lachnospiraceae bacterium]
MLNDVVIANKLYAKTTIADSEVDEISLRILKQDCPSFLLPMRCINIDGEKELRFEIVDGRRLSYFTEKMKKKDFIRMLKNMLLPFKDCQDWFLDYHNILLDRDHIIIRPADYSVFYLYLPQVSNAQTDAEIARFFEDLIMRTELEDSPEYAMRLLRILKGNNSHIFGLLEELMKGEEKAEPAPVYEEKKPQEPPVSQPATPWKPVLERPAVDTPTPTPATTKKPVTGKAEESGAARPGKSSGTFGKEDVQGALLGSLFGDVEEEDEKPTKGKKEKKKPEKTKEKANAKENKKEPKPAKEKSGGFLGFLKTKETKEEEAAPVVYGGRQPVPQPQNVNYGRTQQPAGGSYMYGGEDDTLVDVGPEDSGDSSILVLRLENAAGYSLPQTIELNLSKGYTTIGRTDKYGNNQCDYNFAAEMAFVSRSHLRIEKNGDQWQVIDIGSTNGTFVNGQQIIKNMPQLLERGDTIMFSAKHRVTYRVC